MNIIQRLKNLWILSEFKVPQIGEKPVEKTFVATELWKEPKPHQMAQIIHRKPKDELEEILKEIKE